MFVCVWVCAYIHTHTLLVPVLWRILVHLTKNIHFEGSSQRLVSQNSLYSWFQSFFLAAPVLIKWVYKYNSQYSKNGDYLWIQQHGLLTGWPGSGLCWVPSWPVGHQWWALDMAPFLGNIQSSNSGELILLDPFLYGSDCFCSHLSGYGFTSTVYSISSLPLMNLLNALFTIGLLYTTLHIKELILLPKIMAMGLGPQNLLIFSWTLSPCSWPERMME